MVEKIVTETIATTAVTAGATGVVVQYGSLLIIDPILLALGLLGFIASYFWYSEHTLNNRIAGFIAGMVLANFSSLGLSGFAIEHGLSFIDPHVTAVFFGFSGSSIIEIIEKYLNRKKQNDTKI